jgi:hypothetical protein
MQFGWNANVTSARLVGAAKVVALLFLAAYAVIYWTEPFSDTWNSILSDSFLVVASASSALIATLIWKGYDPSDAPRRIWVYFAIGLWLWVTAELIWGYLNVTQGEVPEGVSDLFWISGYFFFARALFVQYQILAHPNRREVWRLTFFVLLILAVLYAAVYRVLTAGIGKPGDFGTAINSFYPAVDLLLALVALWLARHFRGGALARPWLGLLAFSFADLLYAWIEMSGLYSWSVNQANILSTITDIVYLAAYLVLSLSVLSQWAFLKYGMRSPTVPHASKLRQINRRA